MKRQCHRCKELREEKQFSKGHRYWCRNCMKEYDRNRIRKYRQQWLIFFKTEYGENPICGICGRKLKHEGPLFDIDLVHFDHRGRVNIIKSIPQKGIGPKNWAVHRQCNFENIQTWRLHNFGILCNKCNLLLPHKDRRIWLLKALAYFEKTKS